MLVVLLFAMYLMMMFAMFVSVNLYISLCMFTVLKHLAHVQSYGYIVLWRPWIVKAFCDLGQVQSSVY